ncbi:hypothetical protein EON68_00550, partial [archaeon]
MWSRPLIAADGAPPDSLTKSQFHALASVFDRHGLGIKYPLLLRIVTASDMDFAAVGRVRDAIAAHMRDYRSGTTLRGTGGGAHAQRAWDEALTAAAEGNRSASGQHLTPREVYDTLTSAPVAVAVDLATVEDAVLTVLAADEAAAHVMDLIDAFMPLSAGAAVAMMKLRRFLKGIASRQGADFVPTMFARAAHATSGGAASDTTLTHAVQLQVRMSRTTFAVVLRDLGMLIVDDALASMTQAAASSSARGAAAATTIRDGGPEETLLPVSATSGSAASTSGAMAATAAASSVYDIRPAAYLAAPAPTPVPW